MIAKYVLLLIVFFLVSFPSDIQAQNDLQAGLNQFSNKEQPDGETFKVKDFHYTRLPADHPISVG